MRLTRRLLGVWGLLTMGACDEAPPSGSLGIATEVILAPGNTGEGHGDVQLATNGVRGGGWEAGSLDVFSLGRSPGVDDTLVLGWHGAVLFDGPGPDLAVFENPFDIQGGGRFMDPVVVEVSADGEGWAAFPHALDGSTSWVDDPDVWRGFAGLTPVRLHAEDNPVDPMSDDAGGDRFDLSDLDPDDPVVHQIWADGVLQVRLSDASLWTDAQTGEAFPHHAASNGPDIDGVYAVTVP